jgi:hypothetical protein
MPEPIVVPPNTIIKFPDKPELEGKEFLNELLNQKEE